MRSVMNEVSFGRYRHFKGNEYSVLGVARHSETCEELVVYRPEYGESGLWARPKPMFLETVLVNGQVTPRFQRLESQSIRKKGAQNFFSDLPSQLPGELVETILTAPTVRIERIVSHGHASPNGFWYDQSEHEWVLVLRGSAKLRFEGDEQLLEMNVGDFVNIPAHTKHRVEWTTPDQATVWLAIHYSD
ncbi:MAG: hypothetical protein C0467_16635 [Planctomycetaceae bacterium]|nr:hypothetical protein [Planctomycetaceae bacterium]